MMFMVYERFGVVIPYRTRYSTGMDFCDDVKHLGMTAAKWCKRGETAGALFDTLCDQIERLLALGVSRDVLRGVLLAAGVTDEQARVWLPVDVGWKREFCGDCGSLLADGEDCRHCAVRQRDGRITEQFEVWQDLKVNEERERERFYAMCADMADSGVSLSYMAGLFQRNKGTVQRWVEVGRGYRWRNTGGR